MFAGAHQRQFDLILDVFDMGGAPGRHAAGERDENLIGQIIDTLVDTCRGGGTGALNREKGLGQGDADLVGVEIRDLAVATNDLEIPGRGRADLGSGIRMGKGGLGRCHFPADGRILKFHVASQYCSTTWQ